MGTHDFKLNKVPCLAPKTSVYQCFEVCFPETSSCDSKPILLRCKLVKLQCLFQVSLGLKEVQIEAHDFKLDIVLLFRSQTCGYQCFEVCFPETSSCDSKPILLRCKLVKLQCLFQVSLGLKEVQIEAHDFKLDIVLLFRSQTCGYQCFEACCPRTSACASKPLLLRCKLSILQCRCQVSLGLKEFQMGALDFKLKKVHHLLKDL